MKCSDERGFTLIETAVTIGIVVMLLAGAAWMLGRHPGALARATDDYDAAIASARAVAATSGNGATLAFLPRTAGARTLLGFSLRVYRGRPTRDDAVQPTTVMPLTADAPVLEKTLGKPPFALFIGASGSISGAAAYPQVGPGGRVRFPAIAAEPPCPKLGFTLVFTDSEKATSLRTLPCASSRHSPALPNPSPTPNVPLLTPAALVYHWPGDLEQTFVATEWGYAHWFAATNGFACGNGAAVFPNVLPSPYSPPYEPAEGRASPPPPPNTPYSYPNAGGGSMNDAPAIFRLDPATNGTCSASVADDAGQSARASVQVMGWLTATYRRSEFTHLSKPSLALPASAFPVKGASVTIALSKTYDAEPLQPRVFFDAACSPYLEFTSAPGKTPPSPSPVPATASVTLTLVTLPDSKIECGGAIYDQYVRSQTGEGVAFNATLNPRQCADARNTWEGPLDGNCYDLYFIGTGTTETGGWTESTEMGLYAAHGTPGVTLYQWIVDDGTCYLQNLTGTGFAQWTVLLGNGDPTPPPVASPQPIANPAGFGVGYIADTIAVTSAPDPNPTRPPPLDCASPPPGSPAPKPR